MAPRERLAFRRPIRLQTRGLQAQRSGLERVQGESREMREWKRREDWVDSRRIVGGGRWKAWSWGSWDEK